MHRIIFHIGPVTLYSYGLFVAAAFLLAAFLLLRESGRSGISRDNIFDCLIWILVGGVAGGRLLFVAINFEYYSGNPFRIFMLSEGGLAVQGAIVSGIFSCWVFCRFKKMRFLRTLDLFVPYVALGQSIGRIGCFFNGCCYGRAITTGLGVRFPGESVMRIPTQLYSSLFLVLLFAFLLYTRDKKRYDGYVFIVYCAVYSFFRFLMDYLRADDLFALENFTLSQIISGGMFLSSMILLAVFSRTRGNEATR